MWAKFAMRPSNLQSTPDRTVYDCTRMINVPTQQFQNLVRCEPWEYAQKIRDKNTAKHIYLPTLWTKKTKELWRTHVSKEQTVHPMLILHPSFASTPTNLWNESSLVPWDFSVSDNSGIWWSHNADHIGELDWGVNDWHCISLLWSF